MRPVQIIEGKLKHLLRDDVDTDQIIPKQFLKRIERTGYGDLLFYDWVRSGEIEKLEGKILVSGKNFGCGSSREHAVWAIMGAGFQAVVAESFSDIFASNAVRNGLLLITLSEKDIEQLKDITAARIDLDEETIDTEKGVLPFSSDPEDRRRLLLGIDEISETESHLEAIKQWEEAHSEFIPNTTQVVP